MAYAIRYSNQNRHGGVLIEGSAKTDFACDGFTFRPVDAVYAHRWVRNGLLHETGLYLDGSRIRYATSDC